MIIMNDKYNDDLNNLAVWYDATDSTPSCLLIISIKNDYVVFKESNNLKIHKVKTKYETNPIIYRKFNKRINSDTLYYFLFNGRKNYLENFLPTTLGV